MLVSCDATARHAMRCDAMSRINLFRLIFALLFDRVILSASSIFFRCVCVWEFLRIDLMLEILTIQRKGHAAIAHSRILNRLSVWCHRWWLLMIPFVNVSFYHIHARSLHFIFLFIERKKSLAMTCNAFSLLQKNNTVCAHRSTLIAATVQRKTENEIDTLHNDITHSLSISPVCCVLYTRGIRCILPGVRLNKRKVF